MSPTLQKDAKKARRAVKVYLKQLDGSAVLLLSAQLSHLDENWQWVAGILGLKTGRHFPALVSLRQQPTACQW